MEVLTVIAAALAFGRCGATATISEGVKAACRTAGQQSPPGSVWGRE